MGAVRLGLGIWAKGNETSVSLPFPWGVTVRRKGRLQAACLMFGDVKRGFGLAFCRGSSHHLANLQHGLPSIFPISCSSSTLPFFLSLFLFALIMVN